MNRLLLTLVGILTLFAMSANGAQKPSLFPSQDGNYWILKSSLGAQKIIRCEPGTNKLLQVTGLSDHPVTFYVSPTSAKLYRWAPAGAVNSPVTLPLGSGNLTGWQKAKVRRVVSLRAGKARSAFSVGPLYCDQLLVELDPVGASVQTTVGEYAGCSTLSIATTGSTIPCNLVAEVIYFAPGVGPVAVQGRLDQLYLLVEAQVNGVLIGGP